MTRLGRGMLTLTLTSAVPVVGVIVTIIVTIVAANKNRLLFFTVNLLNHKRNYLSRWSLLNNDSMKSAHHKHREAYCVTVPAENFENILHDHNCM